MLLFLALALGGVCLALLLNQALFRRSRWKDHSAPLWQKREQWEKDHYWDAEADTWRRKHGGLFQ
jgi:hypothetical protein